MKRSKEDLDKALEKINKNFVNHLGAWSDMNELELKHMDESQTGGLFDGENVTPWESSKMLALHSVIVIIRLLRTSP